MDKGVGLMISVFVALIVGAVLVSIISDQVLTKTTLTTTTETVSLAPARLAGGTINETYQFKLAHGCPGDDWRVDAGSTCYTNYLAVKNSSGATLADPTDYVAISNAAGCTTNGYTGDISFVNTLAVNNSNSNTTTVNYQYCGSDYIQTGWGRTILNLIPGFFTLAILGVGIFFLYRTTLGKSE